MVHIIVVSLGLLESVGHPVECFVQGLRLCRESCQDSRCYCKECNSSHYSIVLSACPSRMSRCAIIISLRLLLPLLGLPFVAHQRQRRILSSATSISVGVLAGEETVFRGETCDCGLQLISRSDLSYAMPTGTSASAFRSLAFDGLHGLGGFSFEPLHRFN